MPLPTVAKGVIGLVPLALLYIIHCAAAAVASRTARATNALGRWMEFDRPPWRMP